MQLTGREWRTLVSEVKLGGDRYRVVRPARAAVHMSLYQGRLGAQLEIDKPAAVEFAIAWWLAARSPRSLIYLPLRSSPSTCGSGYGDRKLDLVLLHHSLGFPVSRWKQVRWHLREARLHKVTMPANAFPEQPDGVRQRGFRPDFRDHLRWDEAADTLFLIGSRPAFELEGGQVRALAEECPAHRAEHPGTHCCAEIWTGRLNRQTPDRRNPNSQLHIECCERHW